MIEQTNTRLHPEQRGVICGSLDVCLLDQERYLFNYIEFILLVLFYCSIHGLGIPEPQATKVAIVFPTCHAVYGLFLPTGVGWLLDESEKGKK